MAAVRLAARSLVLDAAAGGAVEALAGAGIPSVLLKGPSVAGWLYPGQLRSYVDVDLLVPADRRGSAVRVLAGLGYRHTLDGAHPSEFGKLEIDLRRPDGVVVDLHHSLIGVRVSAQRCWDVLAGLQEEMVVAGHRLQVLAPPARAMHLALHAAQNGPRDRQAMEDLERGVRLLPMSLWVDAAAVARRLDAVDAFSGGLFCAPSGAELTRQLGLQQARDVDVLLRIASVPQEALQLQWLRQEPSSRRRAAVVARKLWPSRALLQARSDLTAPSEAALLVMRLRRLVALPGRLATAYLHWLRAVRTAQSRSPRPHRTRAFEGVFK